MTLWALYIYSALFTSVTARVSTAPGQDLNGLLGAIIAGVGQAPEANGHQRGLKNALEGVAANAEEVAQAVALGDKSTILLAPNQRYDFGDGMDLSVPDGKKVTLICDGAAIAFSSRPDTPIKLGAYSTLTLQDCSVFPPPPFAPIDGDVVPTQGLLYPIQTSASQNGSLIIEGGSMYVQCLMLQNIVFYQGPLRDLGWIFTVSDSNQRADVTYALISQLPQWQTGQGNSILLNNTTIFCDASAVPSSALTPSTPEAAQQAQQVGGGNRDIATWVIIVAGLGAASVALCALLAVCGVVWWRPRRHMELQKDGKLDEQEVLVNTHEVVIKTGVLGYGTAAHAVGMI